MRNADALERVLREMRHGTLRPHPYAVRSLASRTSSAATLLVLAFIAVVGSVALCEATRTTD